MSQTNSDIPDSLKKARIHKGLSQRQLSEKTGLTQSHISNIENGKMDLRTSSLVEIARALDLELTLIPRKALPPVRAIVQSTIEKSGNELGRKQTKQLIEKLRKILQEVPVVLFAAGERESFERYLNEVRHLNLQPRHISTIEKMFKDIRRIAHRPKETSALRDSLILLQAVREEALHEEPIDRVWGEVQRAYTIED
jgi:transcriptional regulator with XRE-family HTH domain